MDSATPASKSTVEVEQHLRQLNDEWVKALMRGDVETLSRIMADDFIFAYPLEGDDKAQFIADVTARELKVEHLSRAQVDRKSTRLNSSHLVISYAVFCLKKKKN